MSTFNYVYRGKSFNESDLIQAAFNWANNQKKKGKDGWKDFDFSGITSKDPKIYGSKETKDALANIKAEYLKAHPKIKRTVSNKKESKDKAGEDFFDGQASSIKPFSPKESVSQGRRLDVSKFVVKQVKTGTKRVRDSYQVVSVDGAGYWTYKDVPIYENFIYKQAWDGTTTGETAYSLDELKKLSKSGQDGYFGLFQGEYDTKNPYTKFNGNIQSMDINELANWMNNQVVSNYNKGLSNKITRGAFKFESDGWRIDHNSVEGKALWNTIDNIASWHSRKDLGERVRMSFARNASIETIIKNLEKVKPKILSEYDNDEEGKEGARKHKDKINHLIKKLKATRLHLASNPNEDHISQGASIGKLVFDEEGNVTIEGEDGWGIKEEDYDGWNVLEFAPDGMQVTEYEGGEELNVTKSDKESDRQDSYSGIKDFTFDDGNATENEVAEAYGIKKEHVKYYDFIHDGNTYGFVPQLKSNAEQLAKEDGVSMDTIKSDDLYKNSDESVKADQIIKLKKRLETETKSNGQPFSEEEKNKIINMHVAKIDLGYYAENFRMQFWLEEGSEETVKLIRTQVISGSENLSSAEKANAMKHINFTGLEWDLKDTRTKGIDWNVTEGDVAYGLGQGNVDLVNLTNSVNFDTGVNPSKYGYAKSNKAGKYGSGTSIDYWHTRNANIEYGYIDKTIIDESSGSDSPFIVSEWAPGFAAILIVHRDTHQAIRVDTNAMSLERQKSIINEWMMGIVNYKNKKMLNADGSINLEWIQEERTLEFNKKARIGLSDVSGAGLKVTDQTTLKEGDIFTSEGDASYDIPSYDYKIVSDEEYESKVERTYRKNGSLLTEGVNYRKHGRIMSVSQANEQLVAGYGSRKFKEGRLRDFTQEDANKLFPLITRLAQEEILKQEGYTYKDGDFYLNGDLANDTVTTDKFKDPVSDGEDMANRVWNRLYHMSQKELGFRPSLEDFNTFIGQGQGFGGLIDAARQDLIEKASLASNTSFNNKHEKVIEGGQFKIKYFDPAHQKIVDLDVTSHYEDLSPELQSKFRFINGYTDDNGIEHLGEFDYNRLENQAQLDHDNLEAKIGDEYEQMVKEITDPKKLELAIKARLDYYKELIKKYDKKAGDFRSQIDALDLVIKSDFGDVQKEYHASKIYTEGTLIKNANDYDSNRMKKTGYEEAKVMAPLVMETYFQEHPLMTDKEAAIFYYEFKVNEMSNWKKSASKISVSLDTKHLLAGNESTFTSGSYLSLDHSLKDKISRLIYQTGQKNSDTTLNFTVLDLLNAGVTSKEFEGFVDMWDGLEMSKEDRATLLELQQERDSIQGGIDATFEMAYLGLDASKIDRGNKAELFLGSAYRTFATTWFDYTDYEVANTSNTRYNASPYQAMAEQVGNDMANWQDQMNQIIYDEIEANPNKEFDLSQDIMPIFKWDDEQQKAFTKTMWENVAEGAGAFVPMLVELAAISLATGGTMTALGLTSRLNTLRSSIAAYKTATKVRRGVRLVETAKGAKEVTRAQNVWARLKLGMAEISLEEFKMQLAGFDVGSGSSFYLGGKFTQWMRLPMFAKGSWMGGIKDTQRFQGFRGAWNKGASMVNVPWDKIVRPGLVGAGSMELASIVELKLHDMITSAQGKATGINFDMEMQRMFGDMNEVEQRFITNALMFGIMGQAPSVHGKGFMKTPWSKKDFRVFNTYKWGTQKNLEVITRLEQKIKNIENNAEGGGSKVEHYEKLLTELRKGIKEHNNKIIKAQNRKVVGDKTKQKIHDLKLEKGSAWHQINEIKKFLKLSDAQRLDVQSYREVIRDMKRLFKAEVTTNKLDPNQNTKEQLHKNADALIFQSLNKVMKERWQQEGHKEEYQPLRFEFVKSKNKNLQVREGVFADAVYEPHTKDGGGHKVYFELNKFHVGKISHEVFVHAALEGIRKANPKLAQEFSKSMYGIFKNHIGKETKWNKKLREFINEKYPWETMDGKNEEYLGWIAEIMTSKQFYLSETAPTLFKELKQEVISYIEDNTGWTPTASGKMKAQNFINLLARTGQSMRGGRDITNKIKQLTDYKNIDFLGIDFVTGEQSNMNRRRASLGTTKELQSLINENKSLASKINVGNNREIITNNSNRIKEIKRQLQTEGISEKNIQTSIRNERNSKAVKEGMELVEKDATYQKLLKENKELKTTESLKALNDHVNMLKRANGVTGPEAELVKDNMGIIDRMLKKNMSPSIEAEWYSETMKHVTDLMRTYDPAKNDAFGAYLTDMLNGGPQSPSPIGRYGNILDALVKKGLITKDGYAIESVDAKEGGYDSYKTSYNLNTGTSKEISRVEWMKKGKTLTKELNVDTKHIRSIEKQMNTIDLNTVNYRDLVDLSPKWTEKLFGETVYYTEGKKKGKINQAATTQRKAEFIVENWEAIYDALPGGAMTKTGTPTLEGRSTMIQDLLLNGRLYEPSGRLKTEFEGKKEKGGVYGAGLDVQVKIEGLNKTQFLERLGIDIVDGNIVTNRLKTQPRNVTKTNQVNSKVLKDLQVEIGRVLTNQIVRNKMPEYLGDAKNRELAIDITQEQILNNLTAGKSKRMASVGDFWNRLIEDGLIKNEQQGMHNAILYIGRDFKAMDKGMREQIRDFVQSETVKIAEMGRENKQYMVQLNALAKNLGVNLPMSTISWSRKSKSLTPEAINWIENKSLEIARIMPSSLVKDGRLSMVLEMFGLHNNTGLSKQAISYKKLGGSFQRKLIKELKKESTLELSKETLKKYDLNWDKILKAYASVYKTGFKEIMIEPVFEKKFEKMQKVFSSEGGKELAKLYDAHNSMLQEWLHNPKDMKNFNDKLDYIATMKKNNSNLGVTFERSWSPIGWVYVPKGSFPMESIKTESQISLLKTPEAQQRARERNAEILKEKEAHPFYKESLKHFTELREKPTKKNPKGKLKYNLEKAKELALKDLNIKYEHLKASQNMSFESFNLIREGKWITDGKVGLGEYKGVWGILGRFNIIDRATGAVNASGIHRWAQNLEMAKDIYQVRNDGKKVSLYDHIVENALKIGGKEKAKLDILLDQSKVFANNIKKKASIGEFEPLNNKELINNSKKTDAMLERIRNFKKKKGISVWDFDDTIAYTKSGVRYKLPNPSGKPAPQKKVVFMAGGAGSGKSNVIKQLGLKEAGFKIVNQDISLEWLMKNHGLPKDMREFTPEQKKTWGKLTWEARKIALRKQMKFQGKGDGVVVDGTGANAKTMEKLVTEFKEKGYDVSMVLVNTSKEVSIARNKARKERSLKTSIVEKTWEGVQSNKELYKKMFGKTFTEVFTDNLKQGDALPKEITNKINEFVSGYKKGRLNAGEFADKGGKLKEQGAEFDFSEFNVVTKGEKGPFWKKAVDRVNKFTNEHNYILTARPKESQIPIFEFMKSQGLEFKIENITGLGNSTGEAKANWMIEKAKEGYNDFYFADDAIKNVEAVKKALNLLDVKSVVQQARRKASVEMDKEFNQILEGTLGVKWQKEYSDVQARMQGKKKGRWNYIMAPSAQDFKGLLYSFLGKGKEGEAQMKWFEEKLIKPFARGTNDLNNHKQNMRNDHLALNKAFKDVKSEISKGKLVTTSKGVETNFTIEQAIRVHRWTESGYEIPGLSKKDAKMLNDYVNKRSDLLGYSKSLGELTKLERGYSSPSEYWLAEGILTDLNNISEKVARKNYLKEFIENKNIIFSKKNLNKIESQLGPKFREALQDAVWAMETGQTRKEGSNRLVNKYMNWVNNSVGVIMFANMRSAALQTISSFNYINWKENNPFMAAKAFANLPQFGKDFAKIFNSNMLKQRRAGLKQGVNEAELAQVLEGSKGNPKAVLAWLLKKGFLPTQIADSFAISMGGASYYRNRINMYKKLNPKWSDKKIEKKAWLDFQETTEVSQQSSRADLISQQQRSPLGRLILAFGNTPMQYARIMNKAA